MLGPKYIGTLAVYIGIYRYYSPYTLRRFFPSFFSEGISLKLVDAGEGNTHCQVNAWVVDGFIVNEDVKKHRRMGLK